MAPGFIQLAGNNEALLSHLNKILSSQAHPEVDVGFSRKILDDDDSTYTEQLSQAEIQYLRAHCGDPQDGLTMLKRVVQWIDE